VLADPQVDANGYYPRHPEHPLARLAAGPVQIDGEQTSVRRRAPRTGEHTDEVLREVGLSDDALATLRASGALG
jgi:crotonobetainyl-CoA:carnitine CoA-transferase CaiB-like acyl-CoA transferase